MCPQVHELEQAQCSLFPRSNPPFLLLNSPIQSSNTMTAPSLLSLSRQGIYKEPKPQLPIPAQANHTQPPGLCSVLSYLDSSHDHSLPHAPFKPPSPAQISVPPKSLNTLATPPHPTHRPTSTRPKLPASLIHSLHHPSATPALPHPNTLSPLPNPSTQSTLVRARPPLTPDSRRFRSYPLSKFGVKYPRYSSLYYVPQCDTAAKRRRFVEEENLEEWKVGCDDLVDQGND
ncbi:hypothetical protein EJ04DRAFT_523607 [Polyplosphaeria fusca]|uniref:Uncharacterized protein n=1 Tax=Polyplosphaeria fusca TaxID=682080 RepID=A0A9P4V2P6_9PLEO|nr:hypothetical protein EJ04DRAFT_523607 [Polyplosphaeria fusca]